MRLQAHRGVSTEFPENTMAAFKAAAFQGYDIIELDPAFTSDGKCVVLHDKTLNRTCRRKDGETLPYDIKISDITYAQALKFDAGIWKALKFKGEKIPLLSDALALAKEYGITVKIDNKTENFDSALQEILFDVAEASGAKLAFTCKTEDFIQKVVSRFPNAEIHYDGYVDTETVKRIKTYLKYNPLTVWLALPTKMTDWVKVPRANAELCKEVKKLCDLGIWICATEEEYEQAKALGADVVETTGRIKNPKRTGGFFDCHAHTTFSHDAKSDPFELCQKEMEKGSCGVAFTDHYDNFRCRVSDQKTPVIESVKKAKELDSSFGGKFRVFSGIEIGEEICDRETGAEAHEMAAYDVILGSLHYFLYRDITVAYSTYDFSNADDEYLHGFMLKYFDLLITTIATTDFDILTHITCPLRYIVGKYGKQIDLSRYDEQIDKILDLAVKKHLALEINTSGINTSFGRYFPDLEYVQRFIDKGGYMITLGADAHISENAAQGFDELIPKLLKMGINQAYYFEERIPIPYSLEF